MFLCILAVRIREFVDFLPLSNKDQSPKRENDDPWYVQYSKIK